MTPRERVLAAFEGRAYDRVPVFHAGFSSQIASAIIGRPDAHVGGGINQWREAVALWHGPDAHAEYEARCLADAMALTETLDQDLVREAYWRMGTRPTARLDAYTFRYGDDDNYTVYQLDPATELYQIIDRRPPLATTTMASIEAAVERYEASIATFQPSPNAFAGPLQARDYFGGERAVRAGGVSLNIDYRNQIWIEAVALRPDLVGRYLAAQAVKGERMAEAAAAVDIRIMAGGGDFASNQGPFYSPRSYRALWTPAVQRVTAQCHANGQFHMYASDGNLWPVAADLFPHIDGFYELDELAGMDLRRLREAYPHLVLFGGVNSATLHQGTPAQVVDEVERTMAVAHELGGVVCGCSNQVVAGTPIENFWAMQEAIDRLREG